MKSNPFISVKIFDELENTSNLQFININHIQRVYEKDDTVYIEMVDYTTLKVRDEHIMNIMDRFV
jgi:hypothetical protein